MPRRPRPLAGPRPGPYGSDLRLYTTAGIPTLHVGPGEVHAHSPDEQVPLAELTAVCAALVLTILRTVGSR